jgi:glycosyltransferase involved in cell wall biosynthesis
MHRREYYDLTNFLYEQPLSTARSHLLVQRGGLSMTGMRHDASRTLPPSSPAGLNVIGHITGTMGIGVAARNTVAVLQGNGRPFSVVDIEPARRQGTDSSLAHLLGTPSTACHPVNLFHLNVQEVINLIDSRPRWLDIVRRANAIVPFWELPQIPLMPDWSGLLGAMDLVMAPSRFILEAIQRTAPEVRAVHYPQTVFLPADIVASRDAFGLPHDAVLFYLNIDVTSDLVRKNPAAAMAAFRAAFTSQPSGSDPRASLVVKLGHTTSGFPWANAAPLIAELSAMPNTIVIDRHLTYPETLSLSASCDVYVSLHRSEGLGLNLLEAMSLGRPVIATSWSGNMDFMRPDDSCLVGHTLIPVRATHYAYRPDAIGPGQVWAEPSIADAAQWMRRLAENVSLRRQIGATARAAMDARRMEVLKGEGLATLDRVAATPDHLSHCGLHRRPLRRFRTSLATQAWRRLRQRAHSMRGQAASGQ